MSLDVKIENEKIKFRNSLRKFMFPDQNDPLRNHPLKTEKIERR